VFYQDEELKSASEWVSEENKENKSIDVTWQYKMAKQMDEITRTMKKQADEIKALQEEIEKTAIVESVRVSQEKLFSRP